MERDRAAEPFGPEQTKHGVGAIDQVADRLGAAFVIHASSWRAANWPGFRQIRRRGELKMAVDVLLVLLTLLVGYLFYAVIHPEKF
jgi:K+-transporting ATPase KdpF subunit